MANTLTEIKRVEFIIEDELTIGIYAVWEFEKLLLNAYSKVE